MLHCESVLEVALVLFDGVYRGVRIYAVGAGEDYELEMVLEYA
jgi:hypothetical protein